MNCQYCNNPLPNEAKFCTSCGKPVEKERPKIDIIKVQKNLKNTGNSVYAIGWLTIAINLALYLWGVLDKNFTNSGLPKSDLSGTFLMVTASSIFIILGDRIRKGVDRHIKLYLQILLGLSTLLLIVVLASGGRVGILFFLIIGYLISSYISVNKAMRAEEFTSTLTLPQYKLNKKGWIIFSVVAVILLVLAVSFDMAKQETNQQTIQSTVNSESTSGFTKQDIIRETVRELWTEMTIPQQLDSVTKLVNISAETNAIRYHYILSGIDETKISNDLLRDHLVSGVCGNTDTKKLLDMDVNMEYSYIVENSNQKYFVSVTKTNCSQ
jgi:hypothetical protein